ncbi:ABC transporter permease [Methyloprofundus sedimenti]|uniref:ABC transporter permease n=1 Tax=Methyloprofundus sedimenti TaxID=1420851 RepID=A0A1V8M6T7_9GAMM|nr:ABC transporter permease [Methyloprofundus sedimenti]OQK17218.1 ABC transporter permease [Methyloprofundus sedimenti]
MNYFTDAITAAIKLLLQFDPEIYLIVWTSLKIALIATTLAALIAIPVGILIAINTFIGKRMVLQLLNTLMAMPTVMIGLIFYGLLSRRGLLGDYGLLYSEPAVIIGQASLILPIIINMCVVAVQSADSRLLPTLKSLGASQSQLFLPLIKELRYVILAAVITGFGRAIGEVGAAMMLGGNIQGTTRTMTTAIALETSKGDFELGLALGIVLLIIAFSVNFILQQLNPGKHI